MSKYRIQTVSRLTGLSPALIRAWEARYKLVVPQRSPAGYRLYSDEDVTLLQGAQHLIHHGLAPMQVASLERQELLRHGGSGGPANAGGTVRPAEPPGGGPGPQRDAAPCGNVEGRLALGRPPSAALREAPTAQLAQGRVQALLAAFAAFDRGQVEQLLGPPLALLPAEEVCATLLLPLLHAIGERWHDGSLSVAAEHFGSGVVRSKMLVLLESLRRTPGSRRVVCACPPGELHELGLLMFTLQATLQGWEPIYLGANLPLFDLLDVVMRTRAELVALSIVQRQEAATLGQLLTEVQALLGGRAPLLVGGRGAEELGEVVRAAGCLLLPPSGLLDDLTL